MKFIVKYLAISDIGSIRSNNEDMVYVGGRLLRDGSIVGEAETGGSPVAFAVADGMGGYEGGEVASEIVCRSFAAFMREADSNDCGESLRTWADKTNALVLDTAALRSTLSEMGTTFVGLVFSAQGLWMINIGDSRCYRLRDGRLEQLSTDHSERERTGDPDVPSNIIYNYFGNVPSEFFADISEEQLQVGDIYLLCSDGLSDLVTDYYLRSFISEPEKLVELAKHAGGYDNISLIIIQLCNNPD